MAAHGSSTGQGASGTSKDAKDAKNAQDAQDAHDAHDAEDGANSGPAARTVVAASESKTSLAARASSARIDASKVRIAWHKPTRSARLNFANLTGCEEACHRFETGQYTVLKQLCNAFILRDLNGDFFVELGSVPVWANEPDILRPMSEARKKDPTTTAFPDAILFGRYDSDGDYDIIEDLCQSEWNVHDAVLRLGPLAAWEDYTAVRAPSKEFEFVVQFLHEDDATHTVQQLHDKPIPFFGDTPYKLSVRHVYSTRLRVPDKAYAIMASTIAKYAASDWTARQMRFTVEDAAKNGTRVLRLEGTQKQNVVQARATLEQALAGMLVAWRNEPDGTTTPVWLPAFSRRSAAGQRPRRVQRAFEKLEDAYQALVKTDERRKELRVVCSPEHMEDAIADLADLVEELEDGDENDEDEDDEGQDDHRAVVRGEEDHKPVVCDEDEPRIVVRDTEEHRAVVGAVE
ncbi:hypothetical protein SCUCBS95973_007447 [Sporothrix curviconia]|uniref:Uncharacterized protein n=1 Tax=Sporothrix curviconia TaxID=1260050 RepID=A0ABP0CDC3_9PEZI